MKIHLLIAYSKIDLNSFTLKNEEKDVQMDAVILNLEESLEIKISKQEIQLFKKDFDHFFLVPIRIME